MDEQVFWGWLTRVGAIIWEKLTRGWIALPSWLELWKCVDWEWRVFQIWIAIIWIKRNSREAWQSSKTKTKNAGPRLHNNLLFLEKNYSVKHFWHVVRVLTIEFCWWLSNSGYINLTKNIYLTFSVPRLEQKFEWF